MKKTIHIPILLEDIKMAVRECMFEPFRLRGNDVALFAKTMKELKKVFVPLDHYFEDFFYFDTVGRIDNSISHAQSFGFLYVVGKEGKDLRLEVTNLGKKWLKLTDKERLKWVLDHFENKSNIDANCFDLYDDHYFLDFLPNHPLNFLDFDVMVEEKIIEIFQSLPINEFVGLDQFTNNYTKSSENPYQLKSNKLPSYYHLKKGTKEQLWHQLLIDFLVFRLFLLGGCKFGINEKNHRYFAITDVGQYLLGTGNQFEYPIKAKNTIIIQPNFEIIFLEPSTHAEFMLAPFAERTGKHLGNVFKITQQSIKKGAFLGISLKTILQTLQDLSQKDLPQNVVHEIQEWHGNIRKVSIENTLLIHCPDTETMRRVQKLGGKEVFHLADNILQCPDIKKKTKLNKALKKEGIFVDS